MELKEARVLEKESEPAAAISGLPAVIGSTPQSGIGNYISQFFPQGYGPLQSQAIGPLWHYTSQALRSQGIYRHLPQALLTLITMVSGHLNQPLPLFISAEPGIDGSGFIESVGRLVHPDLKVDFAGLDRKSLTGSPSVVTGKVLITKDTHLTKSRQDILRPLLQSHSQASLTLIDQAEPKWLKPSPALRLNLEAEPDSLREELEWRAREQQEVSKSEGQARIVSKCLQSLKPAPVRVSYLKQIIDSLDRQDPLVRLKLAWIEKMLEVITMINKATYASPLDIVAEYFGLGESGTATEFGTSSTPQLIATKVEYFIFYKIAHDLFVAGDDLMTPRQRRIFEVIKERNLQIIKQGTHFIGAGAKEKEIFQTLDYQEQLQGWPSVDDIFEAVNLDGGVHLNKPTVEREIGELLNQGLLLNRKNPTLPNQLRYRVTTLSIGSRNELPRPNEIMDPVYNGRQVDIMDLLTGELQTI